ncbi:unnamed protein product [Zymoseptoria tritici ST99CH_1A5]|uniref:Uncharacterized protein n=1 Tax=Zymoseptoria tritici ST99CH_1A5 TaxID=1276529 RepID=A0A1Y6L5P7_ZYMTR|nr:unnamed protein product [Zymoseptoria tritici ST99CH_1A5]
MEPCNRASNRELSHLAPRVSTCDISRPSTPDLRISVTAEECDLGHSFAPRNGPTASSTRTFNARDAFTRSQRAVRQGSGDSTSALNGIAIGGISLTTSASVPVGLGLDGNLASSNPTIVRGRAKSKPNLRIAVSNARPADGSLAISFPSPGRSRATSARRSSSRPLSPPISPVTAHPTREAPTPPKAIRPGGSAPIGTNGTSGRPTDTPVVAHAKPATSSAARGRADLLSDANDSQPRGARKLPVILTAGLPPPASRTSLRASSLPARKQEAMSRENGRATKPEFAESDSLHLPEVSVGTNPPSLDSKFSARRSVTPDPFLATASKTTPGADRPSTAQVTTNGRLAASPAPGMPGRPLVNMPDSSGWRLDNSALAAARANVAALSAAPSIRSFNLSDVTSTNGTAPHNYSGRRDDLGPLRILEHLNQESEALSTRQANLRAERQRISANIITTLQSPQRTPDFLDHVLNDQLALVAINSSMDICWAKMKSLECRREDAVAALISQTNNPEQPGDGINATMTSVALDSRKRSYPPSVDSNHHVASSTGRSTPEMPTGYQSSLALSTKKYLHSSDADNSESHPSARFRRLYPYDRQASQSNPAETTLSLVDEISTPEEDDSVSACLSPDTDLEDMFNTADKDVPKTVHTVSQEEREASKTSVNGGGGLLGSRLFDLRGAKSRESVVHKKSGISDSPKRAQSPVPQTTESTVKLSKSAADLRPATLPMNSRQPPTQSSALSTHPPSPKIPGYESSIASGAASVIQRPDLQLQLPSFDTIKSSNTKASEPVPIPPPTLGAKPALPAQSTLPTSTTMPTAPATNGLPPIPSARLSFAADLLDVHSLDLQLDSFPSAPTRSAPVAPAAVQRPPRTSSMVPLPRNPPPPPSEDAEVTRTRPRGSEESLRRETELHAKAVRKLMAQEGWA